MALSLPDCVFFGPALPEPFVRFELERHLARRGLLPGARGAGGWRAARELPDSFRLLLALASPAGAAALPELTDAARLAQTTVTGKLRVQARRAIEGFLQELLDHPANAAAIAAHRDREALARALWAEGLVLVYRLLFVFKLDSSADPARAFSFAATSLWRRTYSPTTALAALARRVLDDGAETGAMLEGGLRALFRLFVEGLRSSELRVSPLGGALFGAGTTPLLDALAWGERACARLLDDLPWTPRDGHGTRERVHYGSLDVEDLDRVYETLLELEPGIAAEPMCRLRRARLEVVVPAAQGEPYREQPEAPGGRIRVEWIEAIPAGRFYLRVGLGRKASGSYYTPEPFVRFLVEETLGPQVAERSPPHDPRPGAILALKVLDPAMGSGHFLVEACRHLGEALYEACRLCDERALEEEAAAERAADEPSRAAHLARAAELRRRVEALPDPDDELLAYLPSRIPEGEQSGLSQSKALALARRLVAVNCLYGVDLNPLAVELAKLTLWLESYAEGLPLTFMDHRLVCGNSLTGPFFEHLLSYPASGDRVEDLYAARLGDRLRDGLARALAQVRDLDASVGTDVADLEVKRAAKRRLDAALAPLRRLAAAWAGGAMRGDEFDDPAYQALAQAVAEGGDLAAAEAEHPPLTEMIATGGEAVPYDLTFPEVFHPDGDPEHRGGFDAVLGNPPWDAIQFKSKEFLAAFDELATLGSEAFCRAHDPYHDLPRVETLPEPAIELPEPGGLAPVAERRFRGNAAPRPPAGRQRSRGNVSPPAAGEAADPTYARILALLDERAVITSADAQGATGLDAAGVRPSLRRLVAEGKAVVEGRRRGTRYRRVRDP